MKIDPYCQRRRCSPMTLRVATLLENLENLEKSGNWKVVREKSGKMNYYKYSVAASIIQT